MKPLVFDFAVSVSRTGSDARRDLCGTPGMLLRSPTILSWVFPSDKPWGFVSPDKNILHLYLGTVKFYQLHESSEQPMGPPTGSAEFGLPGTTSGG